MTTDIETTPETQVSERRLAANRAVGNTGGFEFATGATTDEIQPSEKFAVSSGPLRNPNESV